MPLDDPQHSRFLDTCFSNLNRKRRTSLQGLRMFCICTKVHSSSSCKTGHHNLEYVSGFLRGSLEFFLLAFHVFVLDPAAYREGVARATRGARNRALTGRSILEPRPTLARHSRSCLRLRPCVVLVVQPSSGVSRCGSSMGSRPQQSTTCICGLH